MINRFIEKFSYAFTGLFKGIKQDNSIRLQFVFALTTVVFFYFFGISYIEWLFVLSAVFLVLVSEFMNSALEDFSDLVEEKYNLKVKKIKDTAAAAVLLAATYALIVAGVIILRRWL